MCDDINCCQCYKTKEYAFASWDDSEENERWGKLEMAVDATKKQVITYNGEIISAFFHAHSGGKTENVKFVWGGNEIPYLQSVETSGENTYTQYASEVTLSQEELINKLKEKYSDISIDFTNSEDIKMLIEMQKQQNEKIEQQNLPEWQKKMEAEGLTEHEIKQYRVMLLNQFAVMLDENPPEEKEPTIDERIKKLEEADNINLQLIKSHYHYSEEKMQQLEE